MQDQNDGSGRDGSPLRPPSSLTAMLVERLTREIQSGGLGRGQRLPSENELVGTYGVSRTVVREAITALKATGILVSRRGLGTFVETEFQPAFRITPEELRSLENVMHVLELRYAVEAEAAALAARARSDEALSEIRRAIDAIDQDMADDRMAVEADLQFHLAVARASGNPYFQRLLASFGTLAIPRKRVHTDLDPDWLRQTYLSKIQSEHRAIHDAIAAGSEVRARRAVRRHLAGSRYRNLMNARPPSKA